MPVFNLLTLHLSDRGIVDERLGLDEHTLHQNRWKDLPTNPDRLILPEGSSLNAIGQTSAGWDGEYSQRHEIRASGSVAPRRGGQHTIANTQILYRGSPVPFGSGFPAVASEIGLQRDAATARVGVNAKCSSVTVAFLRRQAGGLI